jgi:hypothetical protein
VLRGLLLTLLLFNPTLALAKDAISLGVYKLSGTNPDGIRKYDGKIVIEREGTNYRVTWFIGRTHSQAQTGIGILTNDVLSIGYMDASGKDFGVVSLKVVSNKLLKGKWSSLFSRGNYGEETFDFETEKVPSELKPVPSKPEKSVI